ncbi:MAG: DegT/DnrJ/EryC1/StrS family aminotransferase [Nitrospira sp.]|nr:DegT/DnrJ/EryC1/StrS family aminotransferase [Nitrospira sp.]
MKIPITKPYLGEEEKRLVSEVIDTGWVTQGPRVAEFEEDFARYAGARYAIATTSCTTALHAALATSGVKAGDEVIVPSLSFIATANSVVHCGAIPVFVDINPDTCNIDVNKIEEAITNKTKVIMPVHQMGLPAEIDGIREIAERHSLRVIEDAACAIGSAYKGKKIGGHGNIVCFSFHPRKVITTGEGGMITTDDAELAARLRRFRHHGMSISDIERHKADKVMIESYHEIGYNYRMTDIQAAIGIVQLKRLFFILEKRRQIAEFYNKALSEIQHIRVPEIPDYIYHNYQSYWIEILDSSPVSRDILMEKLLAKAIATRRGIMAIHMEPCYKGFSRVPLPNTEKIAMNTLLLPLYPAMSIEEQSFVIDSIKEIMGYG